MMRNVAWLIYIVIIASVIILSFRNDQYEGQIKEPVSISSIISHFNLQAYKQFPTRLDDGLKILYVARHNSNPDLYDWYFLYRLSYYMHNLCKEHEILAFSNQSADVLTEKMDRMQFFSNFYTFYNQEKEIEYLLANTKSEQNYPVGDNVLIIILRGKIVLACKTSLHPPNGKFWLNHILHQYCSAPATTVY